MPPSLPATSERRRLRPTHAQDETKGEWFGLEGRSAVAPISVTFAGLLVACLVYTNRDTAAGPIFVICLLPGLLCFVITLRFVNHKPRGYLRDYLASRLGRPGAECFRREP